MVSLFRSSPRYGDLQQKTRKSYDSVLKLVSDHMLKDGRRLGSVSLASITPGAADRIYKKLRTNAEGKDRNRTAILGMRVCQRAWNVAWRDRPDQVPHANPFAQMGLSHKPRATKPFSLDLLNRFVEEADNWNEPSIGTSGMIAYFWLQRQEDILRRLTWSNYRPADAPDKVRIFHHKTGELVELPLYDSDGTALWPELMARLDTAPRNGTLIVTRDRPERTGKVYRAWKVDHFRHRVAAIRAAAGIDPEVKFMGLRHAGNIEGAEANLTDAQLRALSGHRTTAALLRYAQATENQRRVAARKRLEVRTKRGNLSE
jgi:hypothetical protein